MTRILAVMLLLLLLQMIRGVESMGYRKPDMSPLSGSPISNRPPPYCLQADSDRETSDSVNQPKSCVQPWQKFKDLQSSLTGTTAKMSENMYKLAGLLDVGGVASTKAKRQTSQPPLSSGQPPADEEEDDVPLAYVPALDGIRYSRRYAQHYWANYSMTFVPFEIELVSLQNVDPLGLSFTAQWKMLMQWEVLFMEKNDPKPMINQNCSFSCDTTKLNHMCCDDVWVPPLNMPQCSIDSIDSMVDTTPPIVWKNPSRSFLHTYQHCTKNKTEKCYHRRLWSLQIQTTCDTQMDFDNFPFDTQELAMDIYNPYSSRTWFQFVRNTLQNNGGNILNQGPALDANVPSWHIEQVAVSIKCGLPSWRRTFLTQNNVLKAFQPEYKSQESDIKGALDELTCAGYRNLEVPASADPSNFSVFDNMLNDYRERFSNTWAKYVQCVAESGTNYTLSPGGPSRSLEDKDFLTLFGSWLNVSSAHPSEIAFPCLIQATASLTTPIITITITLHRYRRFYFLKLFLPAILCGVFTFAVAAMPPEDLKERLQVIVPSTLALAALQITITATDVPAVSYMIPTSYLVIGTYAIQLLVAMESFAIAKWHKYTNKSRNDHQDVKEHANIDSSKEDIHETGQSLELINESKMVKREKGLHPSSWWKGFLGYQVQYKPMFSSHCNIPSFLHAKQHIKRLDRALLFLLAVFYGLLLSLCLFVPMYFGSKRHPSQPNSITIWPST